MRGHRSFHIPHRWWIALLLFAAGVTGCEEPKLDQDGDGYTELTNDCDDTNANIHPGAVEVCGNDIDENCNGELDELGATSGRVWYLDNDGDGYGDDTFTVEACTQPEGYAGERWDCDEGDPSVHPGADEICDGIDNDCDGSEDEPSALDAQDWYPDRDGDGYGDETLMIHVCTPPSGYILTPGDCLDSDPLVHPGMQEDCRTSGDDDCDGTPNGATETGYGCIDYYADLDLDGFAGTPTCLCEAYGAYTETEASDCDDTDPTRYPGAESTKQWGPEDCDATMSVRWETDAYDLSSPFYGGHGQLDAGDIDGDGDVDLLYLGTRAQIIEGPVELGAGTRDAGVAPDDVLYRGGFVPDVDGDGVEDILVAPAWGSAQVPGLYVFSSQENVDADYGDALFWESRPLAYPWYESRNFVAHDVDGDGYSELFFGTSPSRYSGSVGFTVIDPDGILGADHWNTTLLNIDGEGIYYPPIPQLHDLTGDGVLELVVGQDTYDTTGRTAFDWTHPGRGAVIVHELSADRTVVPWHFFHGVRSLGYRGLAVVDVNGDGHLDVAASDDYDLLSADGGQLAVFLGPIVAEGVYGDWDTSYTPDVLVSGLDGEMLAVVDPLGDLNLDGRDDLLFSNRDDNTLDIYSTWYLPGLEPGHHRVDEAGRAVRPGDYARVANLGDPDGDGGQEAVFLRYQDDGDNIWENDEVDLLLFQGDLP